MKHKAGEKFVIEIDRIEGNLYGIKGFNTMVFDDYGLDQLERLEDAVGKIQQYRALGTVEEYRKAMEKQRAKAPYIYGDGYSDGALVYDMYECPGCGKSYEIDGEKYKFCPNCGQAIAFSEVEE